jgi:hypothetical protein
VRVLLEKQALEKGIQATLARHFNVSRQRVHQIVVEERQRVQAGGGGPTHHVGVS